MSPRPVHAGQFDLQAVLALLAERGINEVQVEAGATLAGAFLSAGLVDELLLYVAPVMLGERARPLFDGLQIDDDGRTPELGASSKRAASAPTCACCCNRSPRATPWT